MLHTASSRIRVRYCECDPMNVAHHAAYLPWLEIARTDLLRQGSMSYAQLEAHGIFLVVVDLNIRYRRPVRYDDLLEVRARWSGGSRVKIKHDYEVLVIERDLAHAPSLSPADSLAAVASTTLACVDHQGKVRELPEWLVFPA